MTPLSRRTGSKARTVSDGIAAAAFESSSARFKDLKSNSRPGPVGLVRAFNTPSENG